MKIGDKVWLFDTNRRIYPKDNRGMGAAVMGAPIFSEHFYQVTIDGETSRSWLIGREKFSKKDPLGIYTDEQKEDKIWDHVNRYKIIDKIKNCSVSKLKQINSIIDEV